MQARLIQTHAKEVLSNEDTRYIALSYCWSKTRVPYVTTTSTTLASHLVALLPELSPKSILDATILTKSLGLRYLWAESLYIVQGEDSAARTGLVIESANMANMYGGAYLTVATSCGSSMHSRLFVTRLPDTCAVIRLN